MATKIKKTKTLPKKKAVKKVAKTTAAKAKKVVKKVTKKATAKAPVKKAASAAKTKVKTAKKTIKKVVRKKAAVRKLSARKNNLEKKQITDKLKNLNYKSVESEIAKLADLIRTAQKKSDVVNKTLAYLEREQKKLSKQVREASKYFKQAKEQALKLIRNFPDKSEDLLAQLKKELAKLSNFIGLS